MFVTGCDSGMGETTAYHLAKVGYHVYAGCYFEESFKKYESFKNITPIQIDVADEKSVEKAASAVDADIKKSKGAIKGLYGVLQCAGIAYTGNNVCSVHTSSLLSSSQTSIYHSTF